jgi:hypothetical protein
MPIAERIRKYVDTSAGPDACHPWTGGCGQWGSPSICVVRGGRKGSTSVRKVLWELANGPVPDEHLVMVTCEKQKCINEKHFYLKSLKLEDLFWDNVQKTDGCWMWMGSTIQTGYGQIFHRGKHYAAHRLSYEMHFGKIEGHVPGHPEKEICVLHTCDEPRCVKPEHLSLGTDKDNHDDMMRKGRYSHGPNAPKDSRKPAAGPRRFTGRRDRRTAVHLALGETPACAVGAIRAPRVTAIAEQVTCRRCLTVRSAAPQSHDTETKR